MLTGILRTLISLVLISLFSGIGLGIASAQQKPEELARKASAAWLSLVDGAKYGDSYQEAAQYFKNAITKDQWQIAMHASREPLRELRSRRVDSATYATTLPGAPDGEYVIFLYDSSFANKRSAVETVTVMLDGDGTWRVSGYFVK